MFEFDLSVVFLFLLGFANTETPTEGNLDDFNVAGRDVSESVELTLKNPQRVAALAMIMGLCLLVYTWAQRALRQALAYKEETVNNQGGKPTHTR